MMEDIELCKRMIDDLSGFTSGIQPDKRCWFVGVTNDVLRSRNEHIYKECFPKVEDFRFENALTVENAGHIFQKLKIKGYTSNIKGAEEVLGRNLCVKKPDDNFSIWDSKQDITLVYCFRFKD
jgi:hypothetical protein